MEDISNEQKQELEAAFREFSPAVSGDVAEQSAAATKQVFCDNWPNVKQALSFLAGLPMVPQQVKDAINLIIKAGDTVQGIICS